MKIILLLLFIMTGCSVTKFYKAADVGQELKKNSHQLTMMASKVEEDFLDKEAFYKNYRHESKDKDNYILGDLEYRLSDLKQKRDAILEKSFEIKKINDGLLSKLAKRNKIQEHDPIYAEIEAFAALTKRDAKNLFDDYGKYRSASHEFAKFALFTGNIWKKSTRVSH